MKRSIILFIMSCIFANIFAQHLEFLGIPLGQSIGSFERSLRGKGFTSSGNPNSHCFKGEFWRFKVVYLVVEEENGKVSRVCVAPMKSDLNDLNILVNSLNKKYGKYTAKGDYEYEWNLRGGEIRAFYYRGIGINYTDRTSSLYINKYKRNYEDDL